MWGQILQDALFAAVAAIGFSAINRPPKNAYLYCAFIAAIGHSVRFVFMNAAFMHLNIVVASFMASFLIGLLAVLVSPLFKVPAETCFFPALLPMVPGIYAYKSFGGLAICLLQADERVFNHYFYLFVHNGMTCCAVLLGMVIGATLPVFLFEKTSFQATR